MQPRSDGSPGLVLAPFRALRPAVDDRRLATLLCPPYDVIDAALRARLRAADPDNAVTVVLPEPEAGADAYSAAANALQRRHASGLYDVDPRPALYVYEMADAGGTTRGLIGAVELRDPAQGVILPHENTMAGPVADRLALMSATEANLEPIYLVYDGGGPASQLVADVGDRPPLAHARTPDGIEHRLWSLTDPDVHRLVATDLAGRRALIADGHHRYATYLELQRRLRAQRGPGPWDRGLTLLVDSTHYGPQVHAIHRVLVGVPLARAVEQIGGRARATSFTYVAPAMDEARRGDGFAIVLTDGRHSVLISDPAPELVGAAAMPGEPDALTALDVTLLHRAFVQQVWGLADTVDTVGYAHSVEQAIAAAQSSNGTAVLLRPTPTSAVAAVAAQGARMPRKSTLFTPKPASGLVMRRFADER